MMSFFGESGIQNKNKFYYPTVIIVQSNCNDIMSITDNGNTCECVEFPSKSESKELDFFLPDAFAYSFEVRELISR